MVLRPILPIRMCPRSACAKNRRCRSRSISRILTPTWRPPQPAHWPTRSESLSIGCRSLSAKEIRRARRIPETIAARAFVERVFERYWREALNLEDERAIAALLAETGASVSGFEAFVKNEGRAELARIQSELREAGVFEVPSYNMNGEVYLGRQHLPLIRSMLAN